MSLDLNRLALSVPKVDLHCHLTGSIRPQTLIELARQRQREIDVPKLLDTFDLASAHGAAMEEKFFQGLDIVASFLQTPDDLAFAVYMLARDSAQSGNLRYLELFVNPTALMRTGMTFVQVRDGLLEGARLAHSEASVTVRFIACFLREEPTPFAEQMLDELIAHRTDEFIGVGLDGPENLPSSAHGRFAGVYDLAGRAGFKRTAHLTETAPTDLVVCLEQLGCDRIDHGYPIVDDPQMLDTLTRSSVPVTCCLTITRKILGEVDERYLNGDTHPTAELIKAGVPVTLGTDDGAMVNTDIGREYILAAEWFGWDFDGLRAMSLSGLDAAWLDDSERASWRSSFTKELDQIGAELASG